MRDFGRTLAAAPLVFVFYGLAQNEYLFVPAAAKAGALAVIAAGIAWRVIRRERAHTPFWLAAFLAAYDLPMWLGGYSFLGLVAVFPMAVAAVLAFFAWRNAHFARRAGLAVILVAAVGLFFLQFYREIAFDESLDRCAREAASLDPAVRVFDEARHPYDFAFAAVPGDDESGARRLIAAAYGMEEIVRWFTDDSPPALAATTRIDAEGEVQRLTPNDAGDAFFAPPWGRRGDDEAILVLDANDRTVTRTIPVPICRNVFETLLDPATGRLFALCEVSHTLVALDPARGGFVGSVDVPGRDAYDLAFDVARRRILVTDYWSPNVVVVDADRLTVTHEVRVGWSSFGAIWHADRFYVARPLASEVVEIDADRLVVTRRFDAGYGVRDLAVDAARGVLYAGNYFDGTVDAIRLATGERIKRAAAGMLVRGVEYDPRADRLLVAAGCGAREIDLAEWLRE
ncbi:YncE family protein [bacterium]|nr:YncE family protein [bacterium]